MFDGNETALAAALAACAVSSLVFVLVYPYISADRKAELRLRGFADRVGPMLCRPPAIWSPTGARQVSESLKEIESRQKSFEKVSLRLRLAEGRHQRHAQGLLAGERRLRPDVLRCSSI